MLSLIQQAILIQRQQTRKRCEICSKLTLNTPERRYIVNFEQVNAGWATNICITILIVVEIKKKKLEIKITEKNWRPSPLFVARILQITSAIFYISPKKSRLKDYGKYFLSSLRIYVEEAIKSVASFCRERY